MSYNIIGSLQFIANPVNIYFLMIIERVNNIDTRYLRNEDALKYMTETFSRVFANINFMHTRANEIKNVKYGTLNQKVMLLVKYKHDD
jgi:uncharacterized protein (UPF0305 family)